MQLKERIASLLERHPGTRPADVARAAGVSAASVADWMGGATKSMKPEPARKLSTHFGCDQNWLMTGIGSPAWHSGIAGEGSAQRLASTRSSPTLREALTIVREHLSRGDNEQLAKAGDALKLMATVPDSDRAFEQALASLETLE